MKFVFFVFIIQLIACSWLQKTTNTASTTDSLSSLTQAKLGNLYVTEGSISSMSDGRLATASPKMRATIKTSTPPRAQINFTYNGPTNTIEPLESGTIRYQVALKLKSQNPCNLVYVTWRFGGTTSYPIVVQVKSNPGETTSSQCGNDGYMTIGPSFKSPVSPIQTGVSRKMYAEIVGQELKVLVDGELVWSGMLPMISFTGPSGVRSDNAKLTFTFYY